LRLRCARSVVVVKNFEAKRETPFVSKYPTDIFKPIPTNPTHYQHFTQF
jgi:hypothetical protein